MIDRRPSLIARRSSIADVTQAICFGACTSRPSRSGGGHSVAGSPPADVWNHHLSCMREIQVDVVRENGLDRVLAGELDKEAEGVRLEQPEEAISLRGRLH